MRSMSKNKKTNHS